MAYEHQTLVFLLLPPFILLLLSIKLLFFKRSTRLPPSPWKLPFIGNLHQIGLLPHQSLHKLAKSHGPLMLVNLGQVPTLVVSSSQIAKEIMKTHDLIFASRPSLKTAQVILYGCVDMVFSPYGEHWRQMRKISVTNLLSMKMVKSFQVAREEKVAHLINRISQASSQGFSINMSKLLFSFTNSFLCKAILGDLSKEEEGRNYEIFHEMIEETVLLLNGFNVEDYFPSLAWLCSLLRLDRRAKNNFSKWDGVLGQMIEEHVNKNKGEAEDNNFIDVLLSMQKDPNMDISLTKDYIKALLLDMFAAGTDTSYIVLEWSMAELIRNPQVMRKLQEEVRGIACNRPMVKEEDLNNMNYLRAFIKEILRLHPPAPLLVPRESMESCQIAGYEIPKKTRVFINYWAITRDPEVWESPEEFRPERFENNIIDFKGQDYQYIPFGAGRRICPGMQFAISTIELALANIVHQFDWQLPKHDVGEELDMSEAPGGTTRMNKNLYLVAKPCF
ncbi:cytochrome P450 71A1-like [Dioscorea cayenensis subsp. rotundata]|uniref:Cytochrome P450 71A1-like n=1 Tax=Dioscorea cayennensis subsp. rotundata TaxID=55577 RepID=A0AB40CI74_DIOCR|nr:cytochrome P450 71A1-like [Dioscorea cayenensis subsp. rotundata]